VNGGGVIDTLGKFTSGAVAGTFLGTVKATSGLIFGAADVTVSAPPPPPPSDPILGVAAVNGIMAGTSVTCSGTGVINADITISPGSTISGFPPCTRTGLLTVSSATAIAAQTALTAAYNTLMGMTCPAGNTIAADLGGTTKTAGVYCSGSSVSVTGPLTLNGGGDPDAVFVFQAGSTLTGAGSIVLIGSAQAKNVYWVVGSSATLNASAWQGNIVAMTSIDLKVNSTLTGRALARGGSVSLDASANVITLP
jgi:type VI secretion system secreted protein VgrG